MPHDLTILAPYLPDGSSGLVSNWLEVPNLSIKLIHRKSHRLGAYQVHRNGLQTIMLNTNQDKYAFLITLVHEIAHMQVSQVHGRRAEPHGKIWKSTYSKLMMETIKKLSLPDDIREVMVMIAQTPKSTHFSDQNIGRVLLRYSPAHQGQNLLCDLPDGARFALPNGKVYIKGVRNRTRYRCNLEGTSKIFLIAGAIPVNMVA